MKTPCKNCSFAALAVTLALVAIAGCQRLSHEGRTNAEIDGARPTSIEQSPSATAKLTAPDARAGRTSRDRQPPPGAATSAKPFVGPFAHRTNPFALPNSTQAVAAAKQRQTEKRTDERLLGFVNVDGRKALLQIDGKVWSARAGESRNGIEVVEIAPAHVTLRREGATWNVMLPTRIGSG